jgi:hypothetical protein
VELALIIIPDAPVALAISPKTINDFCGFIVTIPPLFYSELVI